MFWAVVPLSWYPRDYGAVLGITTAYLVPMAAWVALGPWLGFVRGPFRLRKPLLYTSICSGEPG